MTWIFFPNQKSITDTEGALDRLDTSSTSRVNRPIIESKETTADHRRLRMGLSHMVDSDEPDVGRRARGSASRDCVINDRGAGA